MTSPKSSARFKKGDTVQIVNCGLNGTFYVEGEAVVVKPPKGDSQATVRFVDDGETVERFIDPAAQADPFDFVSRLNLAVREAAEAKS
jgi:hypothetical protein